MKTNVLVVMLLLLAHLAVAQSSGIVFMPNPSAVTGITATAFEGVAHANAINNTGQTFIARWTRRVVEMTPGWQSAICDKNQCYFPSVGTQTFQFVPGVESRMDVHVYPNGVAGAAVIEVLLVNTADTTQSAIGLYQFNQTSTGTTEVSRELIKVYPNPTQGVFTISEVDQVSRIEVFNLAGRKLKQFHYGDGQWYNISDLPRGSYLLRLLGADGQTVVTRLMNKM